ncbi:hypothetical protein JHK84_027675 [Glycine max]|nr:hypothetical protein JHK86_027550 [Glycine max]KAG5151203.1 hypothetical protein JHK84_027675 [Glycine max]
MVGSLHPRPIATFHFLSPHSAVVAFCEEILKHGTAWEALRGDLAAQKAEMTLEEERAATEYKYIDFGSTITYGSYSVHSLRDGSDYQQKIKGRESKVGVPVKSICIVNR